MSPELEKKLQEKYPTIFKDLYGSTRESCMAFGLEIGDGWYNILETLCESLTHTFSTSIPLLPEDSVPGETHFKVNPPQVIATQVKEKFGTLRFYYRLVFDPRNMELVDTGRYPELERINDRYSDYIDGVIHFAEVASSRTCEVTGKPGEMHVRGGWFKALCAEVAKTYRGYEGFAPATY